MDVSEEANEQAVDRGHAADAEFRVDHATFTVPVEDIDERTTKLVDVVAKSVIPELLAKFDATFAVADPMLLHAGEEEIIRLAAIILGPDDGETISYLESLRERGLSLDLLHQELLEPTARHLGDLWNQDHLDFLDVTIGVARLQRMVHYFARLDQIPFYDELRRVLVVQTPGELHSFGITVIRRFLTAGGWNVHALPHMTVEQIEEAVSKEWFGVAGFSAGGFVSTFLLAKYAHGYGYDLQGGISYYGFTDLNTWFAYHRSEAKGLLPTDPALAGGNDPNAICYTSHGPALCKNHSAELLAAVGAHIAGPSAAKLQSFSTTNVIDQLVAQGQGGQVAPIYGVFGTKDPNIIPAINERQIQSLWSLAGSEYQYTTYNGTHGAEWTVAPDAVNWLAGKLASHH